MAERIIQTGYRQLARDVRPDRASHGDPALEDAQALNLARDELLARVASAPPPWTPPHPDAPVPARAGRKLVKRAVLDRVCGRRVQCVAFSPVEVAFESEESLLLRFGESGELWIKKHLIARGSPIHDRDDEDAATVIVARPWAERQARLHPLPDPLAPAAGPMS